MRAQIAEGGGSTTGETCRPRTTPSHSTRMLMPKMTGMAMRTARRSRQGELASHTLSAQAASQKATDPISQFIVPSPSA